MYSVYLKKTEQSDSILDVRCWMFDVRRSIYYLFQLCVVSHEDLVRDAKIVENLVGAALSRDWDLGVSA